MKKLVIGAALAMLIASPVFAQSYDPDLGTGNVLNVPAAGAGTHAFAYAPTQRLNGIRAQAGAPDTVYRDGHYIGQDPDPNVRLQLRRDSGMYD